MAVRTALRRASFGFGLSCREDCGHCALVAPVGVDHALLGGQGATAALLLIGGRNARRLPRCAIELERHEAQPHARFLEERAGCDAEGVAFKGIRQPLVAIAVADRCGVAGDAHHGRVEHLGASTYEAARRVRDENLADITEGLAGSVLGEARVVRAWRIRSPKHGAPVRLVIAQDRLLQGDRNRRRRRGRRRWWVLAG